MRVEYRQAEGRGRSPLTMLVRDVRVLNPSGNREVGKKWLNSGYI